MALIIGVDTYTTAAEAIAYLQLRQLPFETDADKVEALLRLSVDILEGLQYKGTRTTPTQGLAFPRRGLTVDGIPVSELTIPKSIVLAQTYLAYYIYNGATPLAIGGRLVKKEKVSVLQVEYVNGKSETVAVCEMPLVWTNLIPLVAQTFAFPVAITV